MVDNNFFANFAPFIETSEKYAEIQSEFFSSWVNLIEQANNANLPAIKDRRFADDAWQENKPALFTAHAYLLIAKTLQDMAKSSSLDKQAQERLEFSVMQLVQAMSPANFLATNPVAINDLINTKGESLQKGLANLLSDLSQQKITQTDESVFKLGENLATTAGSVVFENQLFQLIHYKPKNNKVYEKPLLMVPPCIN